MKTDINLLRSMRCLYLGTLLFLLGAFIPVSAIAVAPIDVSIDVQAQQQSLGTTGGPLTINRVELRFVENQQGDITVPINGLVTPQVTFKYIGNGTLSYQWLVDGRVIQQHSSSLVYGTSITLNADEIPSFPTFTPGLHTVTLRLFSPAVTFTIPTIHYFVDANAPTLPEKIDLLRPMDNFFVYPDELNFSWRTPVFGRIHRLTIWREDRPILSALTQEQKYTLPTALETGDYQWQVSALDDFGEILATSVKRPFRMQNRFNQDFQGGVFFRSVGVGNQAGQDHEGLINTVEPGSNSVIGSFSNRNTIPPPLMRTSRSINYDTELTSGQFVSLYARIENSTVLEQRNIILELRNSTKLLARKIIPSIQAHHYFSTSINYNVPVLTSKNQLQLKIYQQAQEQDKAIINWTNTTSISAHGFNFREQQDTNVPRDLAPLTCRVSSDYLGEIVTPPSGWESKLPPLSADLLSARVIEMETVEGHKQTVNQESWFSGDEKEKVFFTAEISDHGFMDAYQSQRDICASWRRRTSRRIKNIASAIAPDGTFSSIGKLGKSTGSLSKTTICSGAKGTAKINCLDKVSQGNLSNYSQEERAATAKMLNITAQDFLKSIPTATYPLYFEITATINDKSQTVWKDSSAKIELAAGEQNTQHKSSTVRLPGKPGLFQISLSQIDPQVPLYTTLKGGLPRFLEIAGFTLKVKQYTRNKNGRLSGLATTYWRGDLSRQEIPITFRDITFRRDSIPLYATVTAGQAELTETGTRLILGQDKEHAYHLQLLALKLLANQATANITFTLPEIFHTTDHTILLDDINVINGGEFLAEYHFPADFSDMTLARGDLDIRLANSLFFADFAEHLNNDQISTDPTWQGIVLGNGVIRALVRPRPENPELGLMPAANHAYLLGRFSHLELSDTGQLNGKATLVSPTTLRAFFGKSTDHFIDLLAPLDFRLELSGGIFQILKDGVGGIDLAGRLLLPEQYDSEPLYFFHLTRLIANGQAKGFQTENLDNNLPNFTIAGNKYSPASAMLIIPVELSIPTSGKKGIREVPEQQFTAEENVSLSKLEKIRPKQWPQDSKNMAKWLSKQKAKAIGKAMNSGNGGLILTGGSLTLPWPEVPAPPAAQPEGAAENNSPSTMVAITTIPTPEYLKTLEGGAFYLDSNGANGAWLQSRDKKFHMIGDFKGNLDGVLLDIQHSAIVDSLVEGTLNIPYPTATTFDFSATLDNDINIILTEEGLQTPEEISLAYWHATLHPHLGLHLDRSGRKESIHIDSASLRLDVSDEFGGQEFTIPSTDIPGSQTDINGIIRNVQADPLRISLDIKPDGNIANVNMDIFATQSIRDTEVGRIGAFAASAEGSNLLFMGQGFQPEALFGQETPFRFRTYHGDHKQPPADAPPTDEWLIKITGKINMSLFGEREIRIHHTARGANVPFISNNGGSGSKIIDQTGLLTFTTQKLRFVNTYALSQDFIDARADSYNTATADSQTTGGNPFVTDSFDSRTFKSSKSFVGLTHFDIVDIFQLNGLSEAGIGDFKLSGSGTPNINTCQTNCSYEKIGFGAGIDVGKAVLSALRFGRTAAHGGAQGLEQLGALDAPSKLGVDISQQTAQAVIDGGVDLVSNINDMIDLCIMAAGEAGSAGAISPALLDQIRVSIGDGISMVNSSLKLGESLYLHGTEYDLGVQMLHIYEILLDAVEMAVLYDEFDPDDLIKLLLDAADQATVFLVTMEAAHLGNIDPGSLNLNNMDFGSLGRIDPEAMDLATMPKLSAPIIALNFGRLPIKIAQHFYSEGDLTPEVSLDIFHTAFGSSLGLLDFLDGKRNDDQQSSGSSLHLEQNIYNFLHFGLDMANTITTKNFVGPKGEISTEQLFKLLDAITQFLCTYQDEIGQGLGMAEVNIQDRQNISRGIAASRLVVTNLRKLNNQLKNTAVIPADKMVKDFIFPVIDTLLGSGGSLTPCSHEAPATTSCGDLPRIGKETKLALSVVKETLVIAMELETGNGEVDPIDTLKHIKRYLVLFQDCASLFPPDIPFTKMDKNIDDLIAIIEPLKNENNDAKAALEVADILMTLFEERADSMSEITLDKQSRALLGTLHAIDNAGLVAVNKGNSYQPTDAIRSSRKILNTLPKYVDYNTREYRQLDTGTGILNEVLRVVEEKNGRMNTMTADEMLALAENSLRIVQEKMNNELQEPEKKNIKISLMILHYSRMALKKVGAEQGTIDDLFASIKEILPSEKDILAYMQAISQLLDERKKSSADSGQENLAQLIRTIIEDALNQGISSAAEKELRLALLYLNQIKNGNCQFLYTADEQGNLSFIRTTCDDGITREFNTHDNLLTLTYPAGSQRYPFGATERHRVLYDLDIAHYRAALGKPEGDPERQQAVQDICQRLNPADFDSATMVSLQSKTSSGATVHWQATEGILTTQETTPSCPVAAKYGHVLSPPQFSSIGEPIIQTGYQLLARTWHNSNMASCLQWSQNASQINRFWDNGNKTTYLYNAMDGQLPQLDTVTTHTGTVTWNGNQYRVNYHRGDTDTSQPTLKIEDPATGSIDSVLLVQESSFNPDNMTPPQNIVLQQKIVRQAGYTDTYDFAHQLYWRQTTSNPQWEFYQMDESLPIPQGIRVGQLPEQNISANPAAYTLLVRMDGDTAYNPDDTPLTEPLELPNGVILRPGSLHISIDGIDFHSISNHVTSEFVNGIAVEKVTLDSGMIMIRWTDNDGVKHLKEEVPGLDGSIRLEIHTEELTDGSVRETTTNRMQPPATYIRRVRRGNQVERWTWKEGEQPTQHGEITTLGHYIFAVDSAGNTITNLPELNPTGMGETLAASLYLAAEAVVTALPAPTTIDQLINMLKKIDTVLNLQTDGLGAEIANQIPNLMDIPGVRDRLSFIKASIYSNYITGLFEEAGEQGYDVAKLRGQMGQCPEIKTSRDAGNDVPECEEPPAGNRVILAEIMTIIAAFDDNSHLSFDREALNSSVIDILSRQYRVAKATQNSHDTILNRNLLIDIFNLAKQFGDDVYVAVVGDDRAPDIDQVVLYQTCVTASQEMQRFVTDSISQGSTPLDHQRAMQLLLYNQVANCPSKEDIAANPERYEDLTNAGYNPDMLDMDIIPNAIMPAMTTGCMGSPEGVNSPTWPSRMRAGFCNDKTLKPLCYCDKDKLWQIYNNMVFSFNHEKEFVTNGLDDNLDYFESLAKRLQYMVKLSKGENPQTEGTESGLFGPELTSQQAWDTFCKKRFGYTKEEYWNYYGSSPIHTCSESIIKSYRESSGGSEGTKPDYEKARTDVEQAITAGIDAQEKKCKENQDITACKNAARHKKRQKERLGAIDAASTAEVIEKKVTDELDSFCANAVDAENLLARLRHWQEVFHELHKKGLNDLHQYDNLIKLWLEKVVADIGNGTAGINDINRVRCAINLAAQLGVIRITQPVENFIAAHKDDFLANILYAAGWPGYIHVDFDLSDLVNIDIDTSQGKQQLINMIKEAYRSKRQTMFNKKTPLSIVRFNNIGLAISAMADNGVLFNRTDFFSGLGLATDDPQSAINDVLNQAITSSSNCLAQNQSHCGMEQVKQLLSLAATAQTLGRNSQALLATTKAKEIIEQMFNESAVADIDFSELRLLLKNILETGDACHDTVVAIMASLYQGMTAMGTDLVNHLTEFGEMMAALQLDIPDFQTQIIPDLLASLPQPPPQLLDCSERLRLALLHLKKGLEFSLPTDPGFAFTKLAETLSRDFPRATDPNRAVIAGQAAMRAAELLVQEIVAKFSSAGTGGNSGQEGNVAAIAEIVGELVTTSVSRAGGFADEHQTQIKMVLEKLKSSGLLDNLIPDNNIATIITKSALNEALNTTISGLDQSTISQLDFDVSDFLHRTQTRLESSANGEAQKISRTMAIPLKVFDFLLPLASNPQRNSNEDMAIAVVQFIGKSLQHDPVTSLVNQLNVPALKPVINEVGSILQEAGRNDYPAYIVGECTDFLVTSLWPDQPIIGLTLNWGTSYLITTIDDDLEGKFHRLQDPRIGIPNLVSRLQTTPEFSNLNLPDQIFTVPAAAMVSLLENRDQLLSHNNKQLTEAFSSIAADSLNSALPTLRITGCGERHPLACIVNTIGHSDDLVEGFNQEKMVNLGIKLIDITEKWMQKETTGDNIIFTPLLESVKDIASAGDEIEIALTAMIKLPEITRQVVKMANSVPPEWQKYLDMFALDCSKTPLALAPPDRCSGLMPFNAALQGLENLRMTLLQDAYAGQNPLNSVDTDEESRWGYLNTMPILDPPESPGNTLMSMLPEINFEDPGKLEKPTDALVAYIDYGRMLLNLASVLKSTTGTPRYANQIMEESIFSGLIGDPGAFFSGAAGGLLMSSELGKPKDSLATEIVGTFKLPILGSIAGQLSMGYGLGTNTYVRIRGGAEIPDFANIFDSAQNMPDHDFFETVANNMSRGNIIGNLSGYLEGELYCATNTTLGLCPLEQLSNSLSYVFHAGISMDMLNIDSTMRGNLNAHDHTGDLCIDTNTSIGSASGGLWLHPDTDEGMGLALSTGLNLNLHIEEGFVGATVNPGVTGGLFATQNNVGTIIGSCLTPYIEGNFSVLDLKWEIAPKLPISVFPKEYRSGDSVKHGLGFTYTACAYDGQKICAAGYLFIPVDGSESQGINMNIDPKNIGIGPFPERSDDRPWGGMPDAIIRTCDPLQHCVEQ